MPSRLLSSRSWKKVVADKLFFDVDILRLEAQALDKAAQRSAHSQLVHDCRILLLSDTLSIVLCFTLGRSRDFRLRTQIRRFASVCLATSGSASDGYRSISTAVTGSAENMTAHMIPPRVSWSTSVQMTDRRSRCLTHGSVATSDGVAVERDTFPNP